MQDFRPLMAYMSKSLSVDLDVQIWFKEIGILVQNIEYLYIVGTRVKHSA